MWSQSSCEEVEDEGSGVGRKCRQTAQTTRARFLEYRNSRPSTGKKSPSYQIKERTTTGADIPLEGRRRRHIRPRNGGGHPPASDDRSERPSERASPSLARRLRTTSARSAATVRHPRGREAARPLQESPPASFRTKHALAPGPRERRPAHVPGDTETRGHTGPCMPVSPAALCVVIDAPGGTRLSSGGGGGDPGG